MAQFKGVRAKGGKIEIRWQHGKHTYRELIDLPPTQTNLAAASKRREARIAELKYGLPAQRSDRTPTFEEMAQRYLNGLTVAYSTAVSYRELLEIYWLPKLGNRQINHILISHLREADQLIKWPSAKTRNNALTPLRGVFALADDDDLLDVANPAKKLKQAKRQKPEPDPLTLEEKNAVLKHLTGTAKAYFGLAFETGMRTSELLALQWSDYHGDTVSVTKAKVRRKEKASTKTWVSRKVLLTPAAKAYLASIPRPIHGGHIFVNQYGRPYQSAYHLNKQWRKALKASGVRYRRGYNCRHTYASIGIKAGAKPAFLAEQLGHGLDVFFSTYAKALREEDDRSELEKIIAKNEGS